jgi:hypothetical protein
MIRTGKWKYVYHGMPAEDMVVERELFDMEADRHEFNNLANDPKHAHFITTLHARMVKEVVGDPEVTEQRSRKQLALGYPNADQAGSKDVDS